MKRSTQLYLFLVILVFLGGITGARTQAYCLHPERHWETEADRGLLNAIDFAKQKLFVNNPAGEALEFVFGQCGTITLMVVVLSALIALTVSWFAGAISRIGMPIGITTYKYVGDRRPSGDWIRHVYKKGKFSHTERINDQDEIIAIHNKKDTHE